MFSWQICHHLSKYIKSEVVEINRSAIHLAAYNPRVITEEEKKSLKRIIKERLILSTFIFCHVSPKNLDEIRFRSDVYKLLTMPGRREIYRIPDEEFNGYRQLVENGEIPVTTASVSLKKGMKVRIVEGSLKGLEAYVQRFTEKKAVIGNEIRFVSGATIEISRELLETVEE